MTHNTRFQFFALITGLTALLLLFIPLAPQAATSASVDGKCNIYGAGHATAPGPDRAAGPSR